jgi:hypothetical protein
MKTFSGWSFRAWTFRCANLVGWWLGARSMFRVEAGQVFCAGSRAGQVFCAGSRAGQVSH